MLDTDVFINVLDFNALGATESVALTVQGGAPVTLLGGPNIPGGTLNDPFGTGLIVAGTTLTVEGVGDETSFVISQLVVTPAVPEPGSMLAFGIAALGFLARRRRV